MINEDFTRAEKYYNSSLQSYLSVFDQNHPKYHHIKKLIESVRKRAEESSKPLSSHLMSNN
jgi:hypothetical protein